VSEPHIRPATQHDIGAILPMVKAICAYHESLDADKFGFLPDVVQRYERWLPQRATEPHSVLLIAEVDTVPAGFLVGEVLDEIPIYRITRYGFIHDFWVEPAFRRRGIGRMLVQDAVERFAAMGIAQVRGDTAEANPEARSTLEKLGFRPSTREMLLMLRPA
jgi:ribosomal protein S18 acetylase RimI-like enzyme